MSEQTIEYATWFPVPLLFIVKCKRKQTEEELPNNTGTRADDLQSLQPLQVAKEDNIKK